MAQSNFSTAGPVHWSARAVLAAADSLKDGLKRDLGRWLEARR
jgi:hypothetical protein